MLNPQKAFVQPQEYFALEEYAEYKSEYYHGEIFAMAGAVRRITIRLLLTLLRRYTRRCKIRLAECLPAICAFKSKKERITFILISAS